MLAVSGQPANKPVARFEANFTKRIVIDRLIDAYGAATRLGKRPRAGLESALPSRQKRVWDGNCKREQV